MNSRNLIIILIIIVAIVGIGAGAFFMMSNTTNQPQQQQTQQQQPQTQNSEGQNMVAIPQEFTIALDEQNNSGQSGTASLSEENGKTKVVLRLSDSPDDIAQPAHIHVGSCPGIGEVAYPLNSAEDGWSETMIDATLDQLRSKEFAINVHKSETEAQIYVSCGNLSL